jgi:hypothetical protein
MFKCAGLVHRKGQCGPSNSLGNALLKKARGSVIFILQVYPVLATVWTNRQITLLVILNLHGDIDFENATLIEELVNRDLFSARILLNVHLVYRASEERSILVNEIVITLL